MTTKESLHEIIETFDDEQAVMILEYAEMILRLQSPSTPTYDSMNDLIGMFQSETPSDIETFKDQYIADAISSHFENVE